MIQFKGFKPNAMQKIAGQLGYQGDMNGFNDYLSSNPDKQEAMNMYTNKAVQMARGGMVKRYAKGGDVTDLPPPNTGNPFDSPIGLPALGYEPGYSMQGKWLGSGPDPKLAGPVMTNSQVLPKDGYTTVGAGSDPANIQPIPSPASSTASASAGVKQLTQATVPQLTIPTAENANIKQQAVQRMLTPGLAQGQTVIPVGTQATAEQLVDPSSGQIGAMQGARTALANTTVAQVPTAKTATQAGAVTSNQAVDSALQATQAAQGSIDPRDTVNAAQATKNSVEDLSAAQGNATLLENPVTREIQNGELIDGVANAAKAAAFTEQIQAAQATPTDKATVQGQLEGLMQQFEGGATPAWAAGAMRNATAILAARGLGASSMAGQAVIQAAMESAMPIAQADAATLASFEAQNLSNRQQTSMLAAQQRATFMGMEFDQAFQARVQNASKISDVANMNFTAEQQIALENSRAANTMNLANLSNSQAMTMANASALANMDQANLSNRQQAAVQNAQSFLQMDMTNLTNQQQTELFKSQSRVQSLFTDQSAINAASQFNASSQNQTDQFFSSLQQQVSQFNAGQQNAQSQFNSGQANAQEQFNANLANQRDQFNAQNRLVIDQNNAVWRREIATADTSAVNRANELNANALLDISNSAYNNLWQLQSDTMEWAWTSSDNEAQRQTSIAVAKIAADAGLASQKYESDSASSSAFGTGIVSLLTGGIKLFG
jgi:hypothetical protein